MHTESHPNRTRISWLGFALLFPLASFYSGPGAFLYYLTFWACLLLVVFFATQSKLNQAKLAG